MPARPADTPAEVTDDVGDDDSDDVSDDVTPVPSAGTAVGTAPQATSPTDGSDTLRHQLDQAHLRIDNLVQALETNRVIGIAVGMVVERCGLDPQQAFNLLVGISQRSNRKLRDVAGDMVDTGVIPGLEP